MNMSRQLRNAFVSLLKRWQIDDSSMEVVNELISNYAEKHLQEAVLLKDDHGFLPIHWACIYDAPLEVIQMLLDSDVDKKSILVKVEDGRLPIHHACWAYGAPVEVIQLLLDSDVDKNTIFEKDNNGQLPIHRACNGGATVEVIRLLLDSDDNKKTIFEKDCRGGLPIPMACEANASVEVIKLLLQASIGDRIEQLGLAQWRIGLEELINAMTWGGGRTTKLKKVRQIHARLSKYEEMEGTISLLALAVWRTSCLKWGDFKFKSMQEMEDLRVMDEIFDQVEYKKERRIKSGADVIIRGVLPFLPVDDDSDS